MEIKKLTPVLMVEDVIKTVEFYKNVFGFEFVMAVPTNAQEVLMEFSNDKPLDFAMVKSGNAELMFQTKQTISKDVPAFKEKEIGGSSTIYFEIDGGLAELYEKIKDKVKLVNEIHNTFYGMRELYVEDNNGYVITFAEKMG